MPEQAVTCQMCMKILSNKYNLQRHLQTHDEKRTKEYRCETCLKTFFSQYGFKQHVATTHDGVVYPCEMCDKVYKTSFGRIRHTKISHVPDKPFKCTDCPNSFKSMEYLKIHRGRHHKRTKYDASRRKLRQRNPAIQQLPSQLQFPTPTYAPPEVSTMYQNPLLQLQKFPNQQASCPICMKTIVNKYNLQRHILTHNTKRSELYECDKCSRKFFSEYGYKQHVSTAHDGVVYPCEMCDKVYKTSFGRMRHVKISHFPEISFKRSEWPNLFNTNS